MKDVLDNYCYVVKLKLDFIDGYINLVVVLVVVGDLEGVVNVYVMVL